MAPEVTGRGSPARKSFLQDSLKSQEDLNLGLRASGSLRRRANLGSRTCRSRQTGMGEPELVLPFARTIQVAGVARRGQHDNLVGRASPSRARCKLSVSSAAL